MSDEPAILFANEAFYVAFATRDITAMKALWVRAGPVSCIHPGWQLLQGRDEVIESWRAILGGSQAPRITCHDARAFVMGKVAYVVCYEDVEGAFLIATNVFVHEDGTWRMAHHHAAPAPRPERNEPPAPPPRMS